MSKPTPDDMRALTLWQPWASLVASGLKRIENRPWAPPGWMLNQRFAIHAGMKYDRESAVTAEALGGNPPEKGECPAGAILATCRLIAVARSETESIKFTEDRSQARWFFGPYGWVLDEIKEVPEPIECRGFQGLWRIPEELLEKHASAFA
jgi:hypothetical protein